MPELARETSGEASEGCFGNGPSRVQRPYAHLGEGPVMVPWMAAVAQLQDVPCRSRSSGSFGLCVGVKPLDKTLGRFRSLGLRVGVPSNPANGPKIG